MSDPMTREEAQAELLPCPFCGKAPRIETHPSSATPREVVLRCANDGCDVSVRTLGVFDRAEAIAAWNRRAP